MNRFFTLLLAASCLTAVGQLPDYVPTDGLVAWYSLNGDATDSGPSQIDGTNNGAMAAQNRFGQASSAMHFDGQSFVQLPSLNFPVGLTVSLWVNEDEVSGIHGLISKYDGDNGGGDNSIERTFNFYRHGESTGYRYYMTASSNGVSFTDVPSQAVATTEWVHLVAVFDTESLRLYVDGVFDSEHDFDGSNGFYLSDVPLIVGGGYPPEQDVHKLRGALDDLGIWNRALTEGEIQGLYGSPQPSEGCTDSTACNFDVTATLDDGTCHFNCQFCMTGTVWSEELGGCIGDGSGDINLDGCVQLNDLLDLLGAFGTCAFWQCGDSIGYHGFDYATVLIGDQCWFGENLRSQLFSNGDSLPGISNDSIWTTLTSAAWSFPGGEEEYFERGLLYNGFSVLDERGICPTGWSVPSDDDWIALEIQLGMSEAEASSYGWRGINQGAIIKSSEQDDPSWDGLNQVGFSATPSGWRASFSGAYFNLLDQALYWTTSPYSSLSWFRQVQTEIDQVRRTWSGRQAGMSVRCIKDSE